MCMQLFSTGYADCEPALAVAVRHVRQSGRPGTSQYACDRAEGLAGEAASGCRSS